MEFITSLQNSKIKQALKLWKRGERDETKKFLIEGYRELSRAVIGKISIDTLFFCRDLFLGTNENRLIHEIEKCGGTVVECAEGVFRKLSYRDRPDGLIAVAHQMNFSLNTLKKSPNPFFVVAEGIEKPGNLGTILRSCDAVKADGVLVCDRQTDIHNPNVVRASVGTLFTQPVIEASGDEVFNWLKKNQIALLAATPEATLEYTEVDLKVPIALVVGTEQYGLSQRWMEEADYRIKIPMLGVADSLNVAMAATLLLYEVVRQRRI